MNLNWFPKDELFPKVIEQLQKVDIVLDIGCGIKPQNYICPLIHICCEPFEEYSEILINKANHQTDRRFIVLKAGWEETVKLFAPKSVDTIFLLDVIEHLDKEKGEELLRLTESIAKKQVVIFTPLGYIPQEHPDGIDAWGLNGGAWQEHKSGWLPNDFNDSWDIYACKEFHFIDHNGKPFDKPYGAFWAIKNQTIKTSPTKVLFLVQSHIPLVKQNSYMPILQETIKSINNQQITDEINPHIVLSDDGSPYLKKYAPTDINQDIKILSIQEVEEVKENYGLNVDEIMITPESDLFKKATLFNFYLKNKGSHFDLVVFLDDDHAFIRDDSLTKFVNYYRGGYNFIIGRLYLLKEGFYDFNLGVQGTTYAVSYSTLKMINFFNDSIKEWGFGEDHDIFYRIYLEYLNSRIKAVFDSDIITVDKISGRWLYCTNKIGGHEIGRNKFKEKYGISMEDSVVPKCYWMEVTSNDLDLKESYFKHLSIDEYLNFKKLSKINQAIIMFKIIKRKASKKINSLLIETKFLLKNWIKQ